MQKKTGETRKDKKKKRGDRKNKTLERRKLS